MIHFGRIAVPIIMLMLIGCKGPKAKFAVKIKKSQESSDAATADALKVSVHPFEDLRSKKNVEIIGTGDNTFVAGFSEAVVNFLRSKGFNAAIKADGESPQVIMSGKIKEFAAKTTNKVGTYFLKVTMLLEFDIRNADNGKNVVTTVAASETSTVVYYEDSDMASLVNKVFNDGLLQFLASPWEDVAQ